MKKILYVLFIIMLLAVLTACNADKMIENPEKPEDKGLNGIIAGEIQSELKESGVGENRFEYILKNQTETIKEFNFNSGQKIDYIIYDTSGAKVYQHSENMMYVQSLENVTIKQGESIVFGVIDFKDIKLGTYKVEVWLTSSDNEDYKVVKSVKIK